MGSCTAGGAYVPAMSDETIIVSNQGTIFLGGPPLVKAATGEVVTAEELGGADVHARVSGVADHYADERPARAGDGARASSPHLNRASRRAATSREPREPLDRCRGTARRDPDRSTQAVRRARGHRAASSTAASSTSSRRCTARRWCAGFAHIHGMPVGIVAEQRHPVLRVRARRARTSSSCAASAAFRWCSCRTSPASWSGKKYEAGGIAKDGAKMVTAVACADVPKFTVIVGGSFGAGNYGMCGRAY